MASSAEIPYGSLAKLSGTFTQPDVNGVQQLADPTTVLLKYTDPGGNLTSWAVTAGQIVKDSTGKYHANVDTTKSGNAGGPGVWKARYYSTGVGQASVDFEFVVTDSPLK